jgi:hypothetical protein
LGIAIFVEHSRLEACEAGWKPTKQAGSLRSRLEALRSRLEAYKRLEACVLSIISRLLVAVER